MLSVFLRPTHATETFVRFFLAPGFERKGIGSILLAESCTCLKAAGIGHAWLRTDPNTRAEKFYRAAGWEHIGEKDGELLFERSL
ncbi:GNAT family N-acetyltransferase [Rhizobium leguminosarum]|uniref:GNAT family N-acetyltransferase n=1 Tax=Rhizobium leguminosarum TaxID=384 RepID=UPI001FE2413D|nr:GNAT family N-acetyltransferase [Rhizobium leguminosarum]